MSTIRTTLLDALRDIALTVTVAFLGTLVPYLTSTGLVHMTAVQWEHVGDAVALALVVNLLLILTPLTRRYGVGSASPAATLTVVPGVPSAARPEVAPVAPASVPVPEPVPLA